MTLLQFLSVTLLLLPAVCRAEEACRNDRNQTRTSNSHSLEDLTTPARIMTARGATRTRSSTFEWQTSENERPWRFIVIHHTATTSGSVESIHREHGQRKDRYGNNWLGIGYHFVIGNGSGMEDGEISATFRWKGQIHGAHSGSTMHNDVGIGVCLIGNFDDNPPSAEQLTALTRLLTQLSRRYDIPDSRIIPHSAVKPTACPGSLFPLKDVLRQVKTAS